jgi:RNA polymerase sigma-70 factor (ECF subfamily)
MRDDKAFERLYAEYAPGLLAFLDYRTGDLTLAEDLLADTFERALKARGRFDRRRAKEKTWLYSIALNLLRDHIPRSAAAARAMHRVAAGHRDPDPDREVEALAERDELRGALARLSEEEREAIALRFGAELSAPEVARLTGEKLTTIEGRIYRALRKLKAELD